MENLSKVTTKQWYGCGGCKEKMENISINSSSGFDLFGTGNGQKCFYCNSKNCDKFGYLTVVGVKHEE